MTPLGLHDDKQIVCDDCGTRFPDNDEGDWNRFMEKCGRCYAEFLSSQDDDDTSMRAYDSKHAADERSLAESMDKEKIKIVKSSRVLLKGEPGLLEKRSNAT